MEPYERQIVDLLMNLAVEYFSERIVQRNEGAGRALGRLRNDPDGEGVWLSEFVEAFFREHLLDTPGGACLVLRAYAQRPWSPPEALATATTVGDALQVMAKALFAASLAKRTEEALERALVFGGE